MRKALLDADKTSFHLYYSQMIMRKMCNFSSDQEMNGCTAACVAVGGGMLFHMHQSIRQV